MREIVYEITADVDPAIAGQYEGYMINDHIPDLVRTGCFRSADISRQGTSRFRIRYLATDQAELDRYLADHAERLRSDALARFPEGVTVEREVWQMVEEFMA